MTPEAIVVLVVVLVAGTWLFLRHRGSVKTLWSRCSLVIVGGVLAFGIAPLLGRHFARRKVEGSNQLFEVRRPTPEQVQKTDVAAAEVVAEVEEINERLDDLDKAEVAAAVGPDLDAGSIATDRLRRLRELAK